jgi:hypothetical protein
MFELLPLFAAPVLLLCWLVAVPGFMFVGVRKILRAGRGESESGTVQRSLGWLDFGFALLLGAAPFVAMKLAEISTGWVDPDGDGMLGGFVAGRYDWGDYVLPSAVLWGVGIVAVLAAVRLLLARWWNLPQSK